MKNCDSALSREFNAEAAVSKGESFKLDKHSRCRTQQKSMPIFMNISTDRTA